MTVVGVDRDNSVKVNIEITQEQVQSRNFGLALFVTKENTPDIDQLERVRLYTSLSAVAEDWDVTDEAYKMAQTFFSQKPQPEACLIGVRYEEDQAGFLQMGTAGDLANFQAVSDGSFKVTVDGGSEQDITGIDFTQASGYLTCEEAGDLTVFQAVSDASFKVTIDGGTEQDITGVDTSATAAKLNCGTAAALVNFQTNISNGDFKIEVNGQEYEVTGLNFLATAGYFETTSPPGDIVDFQAISNGSFQINFDGAGYSEYSGLDFSATSGYLTCGNTAGAALEDFQLNVNDGRFQFDLDGVTKQVDGVDTLAEQGVMIGGTNHGSVADFITSINDGSFRITVSGIPHDVTGIDFTKGSILTLEDVATTINAQMVVLGITEAVCGFNIGGDHFSFTTADRGTNAIVDSISDVGSGTYIGPTNYLDCDPPASTTAGTGPNDLSEINTIIQARLDALSIDATISHDGTKFTITSDSAGSLSAVTFLSTYAGGQDISGAQYLNGQSGGGGSETAGTGPGTYDEIAAIIDTAISAAGGCEYDSGGNKFKFTSNSLGADSSVIELLDGTSNSIAGAAYLNGLNGTTTAGTGPDNYDDIASIINTSLPSVVTCSFTVDYFVFTSVVKGDASHVGYLESVASPVQDISGDSYLDGQSGKGSLFGGSGPNDMPEVADIISAAITGAICTYSGDHFIITSESSGVSSTVSVLDVGSAGTSIAGSGYMNGIDGTPTPGGIIDSYDEVAQKITSFLSDATCEYFSEPYGHFKIISDSVGDSSSVSILKSGSTGTDISGSEFLNGSDLSSVRIVAGHTYVNIVGEIQEILEANDSAFFLAMTKEVRDNQDVEDIADFVAALSLPHQYFITSNNPLLLDSSVNTDIASKLKLAENSTTWVQYSSYPDEYPEVSALGRAATIDFEGQDTTLTLKHKKLPGITPETRDSSPSFNSSKLAVVNSKNANVLSVEIGNSVIVSNAMMSVGKYQDDLHGSAWLADSMQVGVTALLHSSLKVPYTNPGVAQVVSVVVASLEQGIRNGMLAPTLDEDGNFKQAYEINATLIQNVPLSERQNRQYNALTWVAYLAGAIHSVTINGVLTLPTA